MEESNVLLDELNPFGSLRAVVDDDGRTVYLYLLSTSNDRPITTVWMGNRVCAPEQADFQSMQDGLPPLMAADVCRHPEGIEALDPDQVSAVWFEEGDGVAIYAADRMIAVAPSWAGRKAFPGHSDEARTESEFAWPLYDEARATFEARCARARAYWDWRCGDDAWSTIQDAGMSFLESRLGEHKRYWAADGGEFPPLAIASFTPEAYPNVIVYATIGMSAQPMPKVEMAHEDPAPYRRIELAIATQGEQEWAPRLLSSLVRYPWTQLTWLGDGHTMSYGRGNIEAVLLTSSPPSSKSGTLFKRRDLPAPDLSGMMDRSGDPVTFLWPLPISEEEQRKAESSGSSAVLADIARQGRGWISGS